MPTDPQPRSEGRKFFDALKAYTRALECVATMTDSVDQVGGVLLLEDAQVKLDAVIAAHEQALASLTSERDAAVKERDSYQTALVKQSAFIHTLETEKATLQQQVSELQKQKEARNGL